MLCDPADQVAGLPNMPPILTLLAFLHHRRYVFCSLPPCDCMESYYLAKGFHDRQRTYGWLDYNLSDVYKEHHSDRHDQTSESE
jgi:hypothetical protein